MRRAFRLAFIASVFLATTSTSRAGFVYTAVLSGPAEAPPNASPGAGFTVVEIDTTAHTLRVQTTFSGLLGTTTASHIHSATATPGVGNVGVATQLPSFSGFPLGVSSGTHDATFDTTLASTWNPAFITANGGTPLGAEASLAAGLAAGRAYLNIHTNLFPGGEIRGFLQPVPEPTGFVLAAVGVGCLLLARRKSVA